MYIFGKPKDYQAPAREKLQLELVSFFKRRYMLPLAYSKYRQTPGRGGAQWNLHKTSSAKTSGNTLATIITNFEKLLHVMVTPICADCSIV